MEIHTMQVVPVTETRSVPLDNGRALPARPARFDPSAGPRGRLVVPFAGAMSMAISLLPVFASIRRQHPRLTIDVAAPPGPAEVFGLSPHVERVIPYPATIEQWDGYDHYLSIEGLLDAAKASDRSMPEAIADAIGVPLTDPAYDLDLPRAVTAAAMPSPIPLVGLGAGHEGVLRAYPPHLMRDLVVRLIEAELGCVLFGHCDDSLQVPLCPPIVTDMRSQTPTVLELAVWLNAVDVVVSHDSFVLHLAGALNRPAVGLFAPTSAAHASPYPRAAALASSLECSPCHAIEGTCPRGYDRCVAWETENVSPGAVLQAVHERLGDRYEHARVAAGG